jgi:hypothetical protein
VRVAYGRYDEEVSMPRLRAAKPISLGGSAAVGGFAWPRPRLHLKLIRLSDGLSWAVLNGSGRSGRSCLTGSGGGGR